VNISVSLIPAICGLIIIAYKIIMSSKKSFYFLLQITKIFGIEKFLNGYV